MELVANRTETSSVSEQTEAEQRSLAIKAIGYSCQCISNNHNDGSISDRLAHLTWNEIKPRGIHLSIVSQNLEYGLKFLGLNMTLKSLIKIYGCSAKHWNAQKNNCFHCNRVLKVFGLNILATMLSEPNFNGYLNILARC